MNANRPTLTSGSNTLLTVVIVVAVLHFAQVVFIPIALSILVAFLLAPLVVRLRTLGLGRVPAAGVVVVVAFAVTIVMGGLMLTQFADLAKRLPEYQQNVHQKLETIRNSGGGIINRLTQLAHSISEDLTPRPKVPPSAGSERPVPVEIRESPLTPMDLLRTMVGSMLHAGLTIGIVSVFVIFILIQREDLRDRIIRLAGASRVDLTTRVLDDAAKRISRFLLAQLAVNGSFGAIAGIGLYFIGVPNPLLWALLAIVLRYVPYLGIWVAAALPAGIAFAVEPGWGDVILIFALYFGIDLVIYNFIEPLLYGSSTGISPTAILVTAVFWTWLWGPVGLLLATPLTVCVVVLGRHIPHLEFLSILLSDEPVLAPQTRFYQRLLAMDLDEATEVAETYLKEKGSLEQLYDCLLVPALTLAEADRYRGKMDQTRQDYIIEGTRFLVDDLAERMEEVVAGKTAPKGRTNLKLTPEETLSETEIANVQVICIPARDEGDGVAALMLTKLLQKRGLTVHEVPSGGLVGESVGEVSRCAASVACVCSIPPFGYSHARYLCTKLRKQFPHLKLVGLILTERDPKEIKQRQPAIAADEVTTTLQQAMAQIISLAHVDAVPPAPANSFPA